MFLLLFWFSLVCLFCCCCFVLCVCLFVCFFVFLLCNVSLKMHSGHGSMKINTMCDMKRKSDSENAKVVLL